MPGFTPEDHKRVSNVTKYVERNKQFASDPEPDPKTKPRGLVRVMLIDDISFGDAGLPSPTKGNFPGEMYCAAVITEQTDDNLWLVRCVAADTTDVERTWQLRLLPPERGMGILTPPISEHATADEVAEAINSTGCPEVKVSGAGKFVKWGGNERELPARQWHIRWAADGEGAEWLMTTTRFDEANPNGDPEYQVGAEEVPIMLQPTIFQPTTSAEWVWSTYQLTFATPSPGTFALCQVLPGLGLVIVDKECWVYVD